MVTNNGSIRIGRAEWLLITTVLVGKELGFKKLGNRMHEIYFMEFFLTFYFIKYIILKHYANGTE